MLHHPSLEEFVALARQGSVVPVYRRLIGDTLTPVSAFCDRMVIFDHVAKTVAVVAHAHVEPRDLEGSYRQACVRVDRLVERLQQGVADLQLTDVNPAGEVRRPYESNFTPAAFEAAVE